MHPSFGRYSPKQFAEAMSQPFGQSAKYLENIHSGFCECCNKHFKDVESHQINNKSCREFKTKYLDKVKERENGKS